MRVDDLIAAVGEYEQWHGVAPDDFEVVLVDGNGERRNGIVRARLSPDRRALLLTADGADDLGSDEDETVRAWFEEAADALRAAERALRASENRRAS